MSETTSEANNAALADNSPLEQTDESKTEPIAEKSAEVSDVPKEELATEPVVTSEEPISSPEPDDEEKKPIYVVENGVCSESGSKPNAQTDPELNGDLVPELSALTVSPETNEPDSLQVEEKGDVTNSHRT